MKSFPTLVSLLCSQAWHPAESPGDCSSSPAAPSTSPWAGWAPRAGGGDPGLRRWGAGGPRGLLQRSVTCARLSQPTLLSYGALRWPPWPTLSSPARLPTLFLQSSILMGLAVHVCRHYNSQFRIARLLPKCQRWTEFPATAQEDKGSFTTFKALIITQPRFKMVHHSVKLYFTLISTPQHVSITYHEHHFKWNFSPFFPDGFFHCV